MQVWKYPLREAPGIPLWIKMPDGAEILHGEMQGDDLCLWALVDLSCAEKARCFIIVGTGHEFALAPDMHAAHCATVLTSGGALVWHVFEIAPLGQVRFLATKGV